MVYSTQRHRVRIPIGGVRNRGTSGSLTALVTGVTVGRSKVRRVVVLIAALALVGTACDESGSEATPAPSTTTAATTTTAPPSTVTTTTTTAPGGGASGPIGEELPEGIARVHYHNPRGDYADWVLHVWEDTTESVTWESGLERTGNDDFGIYWDVGLTDGAARLGFIVHRGDEKDPGPDMFLDIAGIGRSVFFVSGAAETYPTAEAALAAAGPVAGPGEPLQDGFARVHYFRPDGDYGAFRLHVWEDTTESVTWERGLDITAADSYGVYWDVGLAADWSRVGFIVHRGDEKDPGPDMFLLAEDHGREVWLVSGSNTIYTAPPDLSALPAGDLGKAQAYWPTSSAVAWAVPDGAAEYRLYGSPRGSLELGGGGITGGTWIDLVPAENGLAPAVTAKFPHLAGLTALTLPDLAPTEIDGLLRGQLAVAALSSDGRVIDATGLQIPGIVDELYATDAPLGVTFSGPVPTLSVWAPTARKVRLLLFNTSSAVRADATIDMTRAADGVWRATGTPSWNGKYYLYEVEVYAPSTGRVETNLVTDPYSVSLGINSRKSHIVDLDDPAVTPLGWESVTKPPLPAPEDSVLYELHVRDFSAVDATVPADFRGTFKAFTVPRSAGADHLRKLAEAGVSHVHLLPVFDIATIDENPLQRREPAGDLAALRPGSDEQQAAVTAVADLDAFNWGYDPWHYTVPEGSYSTDPDGPTRILEFREMVQALNGLGLRVVVDVVYNHTNAAGQAPKSVLDRIVPGYYHRLDGNGLVATSTCCANTATEHDMMRRLMVDSVVTWARDYKVDGFRFDLMGHHMVDDMVAVRTALDTVDPTIYIYGEGWNFGEVADGARGNNATQLNVGGLGIGTFNDRIRDAVRGGSPFGGLQEQGFATGLWYDPNNVDQGPPEEQLDDLLHRADQIRVGLAGNLANYTFTAADGTDVTGAGVDYNGAPAGYATDPQETINYVSAHDNETFFDMIQTKAPRTTSMRDRVRMQNLALDIVAFGQGIPFFHAGSEILRSKSLDRDSFNSGDWFNAIDFTYVVNNWAKGLPVESKNADRWELAAELFADDSLTPGTTDIRRALNRFLESMRIRAGSPLFRLQTAQEVQERVRFHNTGPGQIPGLIVMTIDDTVGADLDPQRRLVIVAINATTGTTTFTLDQAAGAALHPILAQSSDRVVREASVQGATISVPPRTAAVFEVGQ